MAKRKRKATTAELIDWRMGHHIEAAAQTISRAFHRVADELARANQLQAEELEIRREHLLSVLESKTLADKAAQRLMGLMPDLPGIVHDLRPKGRDLHDLGDGPRPGPEWVKDVLDDKPS